MAERYRRRFIGKTLDLIIEDSDAGRFSGTIRGMSGNYLRVLVNQGKDLKPKDLVRVLIDSEQDGYLIGIPIPA